MTKLNQRRNSGLTPLHVCCHFQNDSIMRLLLRQPELEPDLPDPLGRSPFFTCCRLGMDFLLRYWPMIPMLMSIWKIILVEPLSKRLWKRQGFLWLDFCCLTRALTQTRGTGQENLLSGSQWWTTCLQSWKFCLLRITSFSLMDLQPTSMR